MSVLVVCAHPDDESLAMGGTIATLTQAGERVIVCALADGVGSRLRWYQWFAHQTQRSWRAECFREACERLGAEGHLYQLFPDQRADAIPQLAINQAAEYLVNKFAPYEVYTHWIGDLNLDHRAVAEAVIVATRPGSARYVRRVYAMSPEFPELAMREWKPTEKRKLSDPARSAKLAACWQYKGELRPFPHPRSYIALGQVETEAFMEIR